MWNTALTILGIGVMIGGSIIINRMFPNMTMGKKKAAAEVSYSPVGIDANGIVIMKKDIDCKS